MAKPLTDKEVLARLGGPAVLTAELGYSEHAIAKWMNSDRGIPWKARAQIRELARKNRVRLPVDFERERRIPKQQDAA